MASHSYRTRSADRTDRTDRKPTVFIRTLKRMSSRGSNAPAVVSQSPITPKPEPMQTVTRRHNPSVVHRSHIRPPAYSSSITLSSSTQRIRPNSTLSKQVTTEASVSPTVIDKRNVNLALDIGMGGAEEEKAEIENPSILENKEKVDCALSDFGADDNSAMISLHPKSSNLQAKASSLGRDCLSASLTFPLNSSDNSCLDIEDRQERTPPANQQPCAKSQAVSQFNLKRSSPASNSTLSGETTPFKKSREGSVEIIDLEDTPNTNLASQAFSLAAIRHNIQSYSCDTCKVDFQTARMLQQHNQQFHADKNYVCEICSKAFRFRSNLAEHRSVHTALKPFVCKFCGKSSRLKGNLTKHILKHHKTEQLDYIGTDEIIIKKGKKSVKDPIAIEFLEKSMIVMTPTQAQSPGLFNVNGGGNSSRHSTSNPSASDDSMTPLSGLNGQKQDNGLDERCFLMSLGLDSGSLDLKAESSESDFSVVGGSSTANDQILEKCNLFMETNKEPPTNEEDEEMGQEEERQPTPMTSTAAAGILFNVLQKSLHKSTPTTQQKNGWASGGPFKPSTPNGKPSLLDSLAAEISKSQMSAVPKLLNGSNQSMNSKATTCPECGKHVRKPRDLITHLATIHNIAPSDQLINIPTVGPSSHSKTEDHGVQADLRQLLQLVLEMKTNSGQTHKLEQLVSNIDTRVGRLEKQLEMALNSIYTLVQLQTGINAQLNRFKEETFEQLRTLARRE